MASTIISKPRTRKRPKVRGSATAVEVRINEIDLDLETQSRAGICERTVEDYSEHLQGGGSFPPIELYYDGGRYWIGDGWHRVLAHQKAGFGKIKAKVRPGSRRDALLHSVRANHAHGLRRTVEDRRRAVVILLLDDEWRKWSNREIGKKAGVSDRFVGDVRRVISQLVADGQSWSAEQIADKTGAGKRLVEGIADELAQRTDVDCSQLLESNAPRLGADGKVRKVPVKDSKKANGVDKQSVTEEHLPVATEAAAQPPVTVSRTSGQALQDKQLNQIVPLLNSELPRLIDAVAGYRQKLVQNEYLQGIELIDELRAQWNQLEPAKAEYPKHDQRESHQLERLV